MSMHPPANRRCQIYLGAGPGSSGLERCTNAGTHWEKWGGCNCDDLSSDVCEADIFTWECDGNHTVLKVAA